MLVLGVIVLSLSFPIFRHWVRPFLRSRDRNGAMNDQFKVLFRQSEAEFKSFMRLTKRQFYEVLELIEDDIAKDGSTW